MYPLKITGVLTLYQLNKTCDVKGCTTKGVVSIGGNKTYCANCYTFVISTLFNRGKHNGTT